MNRRARRFAVLLAAAMAAPCAFAAQTTVLSDDFSAAALSTTTWGTAFASGGGTAEVVSGVLKLDSSGGQGTTRGVSVFTRASFSTAGVYELAVDWKPGAYNAFQGTIPRLYFASTDSTARNGDATLRSAFVALELGDTLGDPPEERRQLVLTASHFENNSLVKRTILSFPITAGSGASFHAVKFRIDFDLRTGTVELDGAPVMTNIDLTRDSSGGPVNALERFSGFRVELYGGGQFWTSTLVEEFDNFALKLGAPEAPPPPTALFDDFNAGTLNLARWEPFGPGTRIKTDAGNLRFDKTGGSGLKASAVASRAEFAASGAWTLDALWAPGRYRGAFDGRAPAIFLERPGVSRDSAFFATDNYLALELSPAEENIVPGARAGLTLSAKVSGDTRLIHAAAITPPVLEDDTGPVPEPEDFNPLRLSIDFSAKTASVFVGTRTIMSGIDLT